MTASAVVMVSDVMRNGRPLIGVAFDSIGRYGHGALLRERFVPRLLNASPSEYAGPYGPGICPHKLWSLVMKNEKAGGHGERAGAVGLIDAAAWDLQAKIEDKPLWALLHEKFPGASTTALAKKSTDQSKKLPDIAGADSVASKSRPEGYRSSKT